MCFQQDCSHMSTGICLFSVQTRIQIEAQSLFFSSEKETGTKREMYQSQKQNDTSEQMKMRQKESLQEELLQLKCLL